MYDLLDDIENDFFTELNEVISADHSTDVDMLISALKGFYINRDRVRIMMHALPYEVFYIQLIRQPFAVSFINDTLLQHYLPEDAEYVRTFYTHGFFNIMKEWIDKDEPEPPEKLAALQNVLKKR